MYRRLNGLKQDRAALRGYTLIEIMIVLVVMGILLSIVMVSYREKRIRTQYENALNIVRMICAAENDYFVYSMTGYYEPTDNTADTNAKLGLNIVNDNFRNFSVQTLGAIPDNFTISFSGGTTDFGGSYVFDSLAQRTDCTGYCPD